MYRLGRPNLKRLAVFPQEQQTESVIDLSIDEQNRRDWRTAEIFYGLQDGIRADLTV